MFAPVQSDWDPRVANPEVAPCPVELELAGRSVAIVGNASSILDRNDGALIESHDLVLRMNRGLPVSRQAQGVRTDILTFSIFPWVAAVWARFGARHFMWMSPKCRDETYATPLPPDLRYYDLDRWNALAERLSARPSVGAMSLDAMSPDAMSLDLVRAAGPRQATLFGFDFKTTGTFYENFQHVGPHDYERERTYCAELLNTPGWTMR